MLPVIGMAILGLEAKDIYDNGYKNSKTREIYKNLSPLNALQDKAIEFWFYDDEENVGGEEENVAGKEENASVFEEDE